MNNDCYYFEKIIFDKGLLDSIDTTYIIHLEGNGRLENIYKQLEEFQPTKEVYILHNKGFKKCKKELNTYNSVFDLVDAFKTIFNHAIDKNHILILEDDFFFDKKIKEQQICDEINQFLIKKNDSFVYYLGTIPYLRVPYNNNHQILLLSTGTHSCIYSKKMRDETLKNKVLTDWDIYINFNYKRYIYNIPLCYQLFPETENSKNWGFGSNILKYIFKMNGLDKNENGYKNFYFFSKIIFYIILFVILYLLKLKLKLK